MNKNTFYPIASLFYRHLFGILGMVLSVLVGPTSHAKDLAHYRARLGVSSEAVTAELNPLRASLLAAFSLPQPTLGQDLKDFRAALTTLRAQATALGGVSHYASSSEFFKSKLGDVSEALRIDALYGKPLTFNPGLQPKQIEARVAARKWAVCDQALKQMNLSWVTLFKALEADVVQSTEKRKKAESQTSPTANEIALLSAVRDSLRGWITPRAPTTPASPEAFAFSPERLQRVEVIDGVITRLRFPELIDFSVLVSVRTQMDPYFVDAISCAHHRLEKGILEESDWIDELGGEDRAKQILSFVSKRQEGARSLGKALQALTPAELDMWAAWFTELRGNDLPTSYDFEKMHELLASEKDPATLRQLGLDLAFYQRWSNDADRWTTFRKEQDARSRTHDGLLKRIREGR